MSKDQPIHTGSSIAPLSALLDPYVGVPGANGERRRETPKQQTDRLNPSPSLRLLIILSFPLVLLLGVPYWWHTTSITRLPLPEDRIAALGEAPITQVRSTILFTAQEGSYPQPPADKAQYTTRQVVEALGGLVQKNVDRIYKNKLLPERTWNFVYEEGRGQKHALHVRMALDERVNASFPLRPYVQPSDHTAFALNEDAVPGQAMAGVKARPGTMVLPIHPNQVSDRNLLDHISIALVHALTSSYPATPPEIPLRALKYSPNVTLSFVLLNEDAAAGDYVRSWDIEEALRTDDSEHFNPHIDALAPVFNFSIESQVLYHAPLSFEPTYATVPTTSHTEARTIDHVVDKAAEGDMGAETVAEVLVQDQSREKAYVIGEEDMKVFVNSEKWSLDSGSSQNPVLRFLLFIPSSLHRPMLTAHPSQSFLLPQFGGVVLLNPPALSTSASSTPGKGSGHLNTAIGEAYHLSAAALAPTFHLFTQQLYSLLALPPYPDRLFARPSSAAAQAGSVSGLAEPLSRWQLETILRQRMRENEDEARRTLSGIVRLVKKIKEMQLGEGVRGKVLGAVEKLEEMAHITDPLQAFLLSRDAVGLANEAFFDPSMMGLLYFPNEHKFAVYTPLFAPIAVPIVVGLLKELLAFVRRRKARRASLEPPVVGAGQEPSGARTD